MTLQSVTTVYATDILNNLDSNYGDLAVVQRQACRDAVAYAESVDKVTRLRLTAVVAAACVSCQRLPDKVSTIIQPLMAGLRNIQEKSLQNEVCSAVTFLLIIAAVKLVPMSHRVQYSGGHVGVDQCLPRPQTYRISQEAVSFDAQLHL